MPSSPKTIFTSNCSQDTIFKFWLSEKVNNGSKLIHGQHGAAYGMITEHNNFKYELSICDRYLTWGWNLSGKKNTKISQCVALPFIKNKSSKFKKHKKQNKILIIPSVIDYYLFKNELRRVD